MNTPPTEEQGGGGVRGWGVREAGIENDGRKRKAGGENARENRMRGGGEAGRG